MAEHKYGPVSNELTGKDAKAISMYKTDTNGDVIELVIIGEIYNRQIHVGLYEDGIMYKIYDLPARDNMRIRYFQELSKLIQGLYKDLDARGMYSLYDVVVELLLSVLYRGGDLDGKKG